jgi:hypothetical protein
MAHVGGGSWTAFRRAALYFAEADEDANGNAGAEVRMARRVLSDLGYADFSVDGGSSWTAFAPIIGAVGDDEAILCGVRNGGLVEAVTTESGRAGCNTNVEDLGDAPARIALTGDEHRFRAVAEAVSLRFEPDLPRLLVTALVPIPSAVESANTSEAPINWLHSAFDFDEMSWSERQKPGPTAHEYRSKYGARQYFADVPGRGLIALDRRTAVYAAAFARSVGLAAYDERTASLSAPLEAPLPFEYARTATLCSGRPSSVVDGRSTYSAVPLSVAAVLTVASGGTYPGSPTWLHQRSSGRP